MPKMTGVVVASENEEMLLEALEEDQYMTAEREYLKKQERLFKNWKKLLNTLKIQERVQREYGEKQQQQQQEQQDQQDDAGKGKEQNNELQREERAGDSHDDDALEAYRDAKEVQDEEEEVGGGGFLLD
jgi:xeroderma pigmentosum group C-complementing protein